MEVTNTDRAQRVLDILRAVQAKNYNGREDLNVIFRDLLGDMMHMCDRVGIDFQEELSHAIAVYDTEFEEDEPGSWPIHARVHAVQTLDAIIAGRRELSLWERDDVQFPRLLAEMRAQGLTRAQYKALRECMDLSTDQIDEILERAETARQKRKEEACTQAP